MAVAGQSLQLSAGAMRVDMGAGVDPDDGGNETQTNVLVFPAYTPPSPPPRNVALAALAANLRMKDLLSGYHLGNSKTPSRQVIRYRDKNLRMHGLKTLEDEVGLIAAMPQELAYKGLRPAGRRRTINRRSLFATKRGLANAQSLGSAELVEEFFGGGEGPLAQPRKKRRTGPRFGVAGEDDDEDDLDGDDEGGGLGGGLRRADVEGLGDGSEDEEEEDAGYNSSDQEVEMDFDDHNDDDEEYEEEEDPEEAAF